MKLETFTNCPAVYYFSLIIVSFFNLKRIKRKNIVCLICDKLKSNFQFSYYFSEILLNKDFLYIIYIFKNGILYTLIYFKCDCVFLTKRTTSFLIKIKPLIFKKYNTIPLSFRETRHLIF